MVNAIIERSTVSGIFSSDSRINKMNPKPGSRIFCNITRIHYRVCPVSIFSVERLININSILAFAQIVLGVFHLRRSDATLHHQRIIICCKLLFGKRFKFRMGKANSMRVVGIDILFSFIPIVIHKRRKRRKGINTILLVIYKQAVHRRHLVNKQGIPIARNQGKVNTTSRQNNRLVQDKG